MTEKGGGIFAWVPPAAALAFAIATFLTQRDDISREQRMALPGRKVLPRALSQASEDPKYNGHWFLCFGACAFSSGLAATSLWQYMAFGDEAVLVLWFGLISAVSLFLMAIVPTSSNTLFVTVYHAITAGAFLATAGNYTLRLALITGEGALRLVRLICAFLVFGALAFMLFGGIYLYYVAADKLLHHKAGSISLTVSEEYSVRKRIFLLAFAQGVAGLGIATTLATGAAETATLNLSDATSGAILFGVSLTVMITITSTLYKMRPREP